MVWLRCTRASLQRFPKSVIHSRRGNVSCVLAVTFRARLFLFPVPFYHTLIVHQHFHNQNSRLRMGLEQQGVHQAKHHGGADTGGGARDAAHKGASLVYDLDVGGRAK